MGEAVGINEFVHGREDVLMARDVGEGRRTVFLDPCCLLAGRTVSRKPQYSIELAHHGRLSSASTGRLAALRLPLAVLSEENVMSLGGAGTSMSISSS